MKLWCRKTWKSSRSPPNLAGFRTCLLPVLHVCYNRCSHSGAQIPTDKHLQTSTCKEAPSRNRKTTLGPAHAPLTFPTDSLVLTCWKSLRSRFKFSSSPLFWRSNSAMHAHFLQERCDDQGGVQPERNEAEEMGQVCRMWMDGQRFRHG